MNAFAFTREVRALSCAPRRMATRDEQHPSRLAEDGSHLRMTVVRVASLIAARRRNRVQPAIAEHMYHEAKRAEDFGKGLVANAQATGIGAERRHHRALAVAGKASSLHRTSTRRHPRLGMQ